MTTITLTTPDGEMPAYVAEPDFTPRGAIIVVQEAFGLTDHILAIADRLAMAGYVAIAPALFHRDGAPVFAYDDFASVIPVISSVTQANLDVDLAATVAELERRGFNRAQRGIVGFCMGGAIALYADTCDLVGAAVTFYGGGVTTGRFGLAPLVELAPNLRAPWLGLYGDLDQSIPVDQVEALRMAAAQAQAPTSIVRYENAGHGFNCDARPDFVADAAADAWARALSWLETSLS